MKQLCLTLFISFFLASCSRHGGEGSYKNFIRFVFTELEDNIVSGDEKVFDPKISNKSTLIKLPYPYLLAGNVHPEIYPHDASYSISLLIDLIDINKLDQEYQMLVKGMLNDFEFMQRKYGYPLNGNRTYFETRSQANILSSNVLEYYELTNDWDWLNRNGLYLAEGVFNYWTQDQAKFVDKFAFHWLSHGSGPCEEVIKSSKLHNSYYDKVLEALLRWSNMNNSQRPVYAKNFNYSKLLVCENNQCKLSDFYYKNDRSSRVSGYDTNHLYGPFNSYAEEFIPVDHSAKLYKSANDLVHIYQILSSQSQSENDKNIYQKKIIFYKSFASKIKAMILTKLWDADSKMFYEYHVPSNKLRIEYPFAGVVYLLWAEIFDLNNEAEVEKLIELVKFIDQNLEGESGVYASTLNTGMHWDKPYAWPIHQGIFVKGLLHYSRELDKHGYTDQARYFRRFAKRTRANYLIANYHDWKKSNGKSIKEKIIEGQENLLTGYAVGENYSWNLLTVLYFNSLKI